MRKKITFLLIIVLSYLGTYAQNTTIRGIVKDQQGAPLPGVSVLLKGTTIATATGLDGSYSISAPPTATLTFSFIGFTSQDRPVNNQTTINITLAENVKSLNEVVVVGFGTQKKAEVTGAISHVGASDLQDQQITRVDQALQGRTSGVNVVQSSGQPGAAPTIRIRGITSINNSDPLYVIDGIVMLNGGLDNVNPNDIESIDVLKDASAAIYGSRASNGVVLITTKKGRSGAPQLTYNGYVGFQGPVTKVKMANASQYAMLRNESLTNDGKTAPFANPSALGTGTNWQDQIFSNNALIQNHNLAIQGGTEKSTYYTSFGYYDQQGIIFKDISNYKRFNFTVNTSSKLRKWLTIGENFNYGYIKNQSNFNTNSEFGGPLSSALNLDPVTPILQTDPTIAAGYNQYAVKNAQGTPYGISQYVSQEITNPLAYAQTVQGNYGWSHNLIGSGFIEIEPIQGLKVRSQISGKQAFYGSESFSPLYYLNSSTSNLTNPSEYRASNRNLSWNWDNTASFTRTFGLHTASVLIGQSVQEASSAEINGTYNNVPITTFDQRSFNFGLPAASRIAGGAEIQPYRVASTFGRITYDYDQRYLFTGIIRRDGSSRFGINNKYGVFPSAELGWVLTREKWFPKNSFVGFLKLRGSYGVVGNEQSLADFAYTSIIAGGGNNNYVYGSGSGLAIGYAPTRPPNSNLKWETTHSADIGLDALIFNDFNVTLDFYDKTTKGMLQTLSIPAYTGFSDRPYANVGNLENKGVELEVAYRKKIGDFGFGINGNISYNHNEITYLGNQISYLDYGSFQASSYPLQRTAVGHAAYSFYGFKELGVFHSQAEIDAYTLNGAKIQPNAKPGDFKWQDSNGNGTIDQGDRQFLGSPIPTWNYGINLSANYKGFDMHLFGQGVWGNKIFQAYRRLDVPAANYTLAALDAWTPTNASSNYPRLSDADLNSNFRNPSDFYLQNGAYFRIKTLQIGYTFPKEWMQKATINRLRIYISSNNLATITGYKGYDPEVGTVNNNNIFGVDRGIYPQSRSFLLGLDLTL
jgi:TonB-linked SusC/RagA family outer membrane protein